MGRIFIIVGSWQGLSTHRHPDTLLFPTCMGAMSQYGTLAVISSHTVMATENTSARSSYGWCSSTSGAIHLGEWEE